MRLKTLATSAALAWWGFALPIPAFAQTAGPSALTLDQAWRLAEGANPQIRSKQAQTAAAEGLRTDARSWFNANPQLTVDQTRRTVPRDGLSNERWHEWNTGLSQTLEIAGQQGHRREAAAAGLTALRNEIEDTRREVHAEVSEQFFRVLALQQRIELEAKALALFEGTASAVQKRRAAGEDTRLDANVALVEAERARTQLALAQEQSTEARTRLASLLQLPLDAVPQVAGTLDAVRAPYVVDDLLRSVDEQPRLQALAAREDSASARLRLERASTYPDITPTVMSG